MQSVHDWRSTKTADDFANHDYADFAQEFLRRNPNYCREYHALMRRIAAGRIEGPPALEAFARSWGLSFPLHPGPFGGRGAGALVAPLQSFDRRARGQGR